MKIYHMKCKKREQQGGARSGRERSKERQKTYEESLIG
jgi:hypothetical protein